MYPNSALRDRRAGSMNPCRSGFELTRYSGCGTWDVARCATQPQRVSLRVCYDASPASVPPDAGHWTPIVCDQRAACVVWSQLAGPLGTSASCSHCIVSLRRRELSPGLVLDRRKCQPLYHIGRAAGDGGDWERYPQPKHVRRTHSAPCARPRPFLITAPSVACEGHVWRATILWQADRRVRDGPCAT